MTIQGATQQAAKQCMVCFSDEGDMADGNQLAERYFLPCRCKFCVCDECVVNVTQCLYHRFRMMRPRADGLFETYVAVDSVPFDPGFHVREIRRDVMIRACLWWCAATVAKDALYLAYGKLCGALATLIILFWAWMYLKFAWDLVIPRWVHDAWFFLWAMILVWVLKKCDESEACTELILLGDAELARQREAIGTRSRN
jgi:hypothetical protein